MKNEPKVRFLRPIISKILFFNIMLLSATSALAEYDNSKGHGSRYVTVGYKKLPANSQGSGMTYGFGAINRDAHFGCEIYSAWMQTIPEGMEKIPAKFWGGGTPSGTVTVSDPSFGFDFNIFAPVNRRLDIYFGPSLNFEKIAQIYTSDGSASIYGGATKGQKYADFQGTWKTRINGQAGIAVTFPSGIYNIQAQALVGYSIYRGITGGIGFAF